MPRRPLAALLVFFLAAALAGTGCSAGKARPDSGVLDDAGADASAWPFPTTTDLTLIVEPSDNAAGLIAAVQGAQKSVHVTMYLLSNSAFVSALVARKKAGVDVQVILNQTFPDPAFDNTWAYNTLKAGGVPVVWSSKAFVYTHAKCVVIDGATAWVMTMNVTASSPQNREFLAIDTNAEDVAEAEAVFAGDFAAQTPQVAGRLVLAPVNARARITALVGLATTTLDVESETLSDMAIQQALQAAKARGVDVRVVVSDQTPTSAMAQAIAQLKGSGIAVKKLASPYVHSKAIVADGVVGYVGSANLTQNSVDSNREIGLMVEGPALDTLKQTLAADYAAGAPY